MFFGWGHEHTGRRFKHRVLGDTSCEEQMSTGWPESNWFGGGLEGLDITRKSLLLPTKMCTVFLIPMPVDQRLYRSLEDSATLVGSSDFEHDIQTAASWKNQEVLPSWRFPIDASSPSWYLWPFDHARFWWDLMIYDMGVSKNKGTPKWMVYNGKPY